MQHMAEKAPQHPELGVLPEQYQTSNKSPIIRTFLI